MTDAARGVPAARGTTVRQMLPLCIASLLATSVLAAASVAHARTTQITILDQGIACGGYSFPVAGQYELITGVATGRVVRQIQRMH
jgi:hypothetical protein